MSKSFDFEKFRLAFRIALAAVNEAQKQGVLRINELPAINLGAMVAGIAIDAYKDQQAHDDGVGVTVTPTQ